MIKEVVKTTLLNCSLEESDILKYKNQVKDIHHAIPQFELTGWVNSPVQDHHELLKSIERVASEIRACANVLVVAGVGGRF